MELSFKRQWTKVKFRLIEYLTCGVKTITLLFWVSVYFLVMKLTIFKSTENSTVSAPKEWAVIPDNFTFSVGETSDSDESIYVEDFMNWNQSENETTAILKSRAEQVQNVCLKYNLSHQDVNYKEFFVDFRHRLAWCNIFKAASSMWLYNFNILGGYPKKFISRSYKMPLVLARHKFPPPKRNELTYVAMNPGIISFIIVREPFVRLLSGYRDKIENMTRPFYRKLAKSIISKQRKRATKTIGPIKQRGPTFYEFVADIIEKDKAQKPLDEHWTPYYKFCTPCAVNFSVIGKVETLERDSAYVINKLGLAKLLGRPPKKFLKKIMNKSRDGKNTAELIKQYYSQLDESMLNDLLEIYGIDFEMFGYDPEVYRNFVKHKK